MRAVLSIGNVGSRYEFTRHNVGFMAADLFALKNKIEFSKESDYYVSFGELNAQKFAIVKPSTYVNLSGIAAKEFINKYNVELKDLLVVCDDINIPLGELRFRLSGGSGGHNGLSSIIYSLESNLFPRLRLGIGGNFEYGKMAGYVLSRFSDEEKNILDDALKNTLEMIETFFSKGVKATLDYYSAINRKGEIKP